ncbi:MAG TPA: amino acid adenylation domain-containing protein, partial [Thermoanaerobaculia bacterium]
TLDAQILDDGDGLYLSWDVIDDFFRDGVLASMWESYCRFVERLAVDEGAWDDEWRDLLPPEQRRRRIDANATSMAVPRETLHERVLQQARRTPDRVAVVAPDGTMTYAEVVGRASALARELRSAGARPNELVAIVLPKGGAQVVAALGVQLSGAAYLPIDIATPPARIEELLLLGEARFAVAADSVPLSPAVKNIVATGTIDADHDAGPAGPDDLAYVIFTSGSTGTPKGVMIRHSAAANTVRDINQRFGLSADDRTIALSSLSFDLSVWDIFGTLSCGGAIVIPEGDGARDPAYLARLIEEHGVTIWNSVPSYLQLLAEHAPDPRRLRTLRLAMLSGDWIPVSLPGRLPVPIVSLGGATEASIWSIFHSIERVDPTWTSIPYGKPLANQQFYVLDERMEDCPEGVEGELYIGGDGLADGYWRDAARTATSFVVHPQKGRLYRTGDWGRFRPSAEIEFLGRRDGQVKIAGHRVELGEVEATMLRCSGVREAVAVTFNDEHAQKRLAAFYAGGAAAAEVRAQLEALLPAYMVPSRLAPIESMPLSANGKVDRNALAARAAAKQGTALERFFAAPAMLKAPAERRRFVAEGRGVRHDVAGTTSTSLRVSDDLPQRAAAWKSVRDFAGLVTLAQIEALVAGLRAFESEGRVRRAYPSAGETWSVQLYLHVQPSRVEGLQEGVYYYQPLQHELLRLAGAASIDAAMHVPANQKMFGDAAFSLVFIADLDAIRPMYGDHAEAFAWMEAGHMAQILRQTAAEHGLGLCLVGLFDVDPLRRALGLGEGHLAVGSMVGGVPRAVEQPAVVEPRSSSHVPAVADATTEGIAAIWRDVLEIPSVPLDERFFELGGTSFSILAVQRELLARLGREVSITDLFRHSTVAALAEHLRGGSGPGGAAGEEADDLAAKRRLRRTLRQAQAGGAPR